MYGNDFFRPEIQTLCSNEAKLGIFKDSIVYVFK